MLPALRHRLCACGSRHSLSGSAYMHRLAVQFRALSTGSSSVAAMGKFYAVAVGRRPGLYTSWDQCQAQIKGYPANRFKGFKTQQEAVEYLATHGVAPGSAAAAAAPRPPPPAAAAAYEHPWHPQPVAAAAADTWLQPAAGAARHGAAAAAAAAGGSKPARKRRAPAAGSGGASRPAAAGPAAAGSSGGLSATDRTLRLEFDGASKNNPGPAGLGAVLYDDATGVEVERLAQYLGDHHTNNQAEYAGLIAGLQAALDLGCRSIKVRGDSTLIIRQVLGEWRVKNEGLRPYHAAAAALRARFARFEAVQVPRAQNAAADALSNQAISDYRSGVNRHLWTIEAATAAIEAGGGGGGGLAAAWAAADEEDAAAAKRARRF